MRAIPLQPRDSCPRSVSRHSALDALSVAVRRGIATLELWRWRLRERNELSSLDERMLRDIGLTPAERSFLVNKPFWRE